jgi:hypothetical protein
VRGDLLGQLRICGRPRIEVGPHRQDDDVWPDGMEPA